MRSVTQAFAAANIFGEEWRKVLHDGFVVSGDVLVQNLEPLPVDWDAELAKSGIETPRDSQTLEAVFVQDYRVYDGRFANNAWLQELPDPITKLTWDNAALIAPATAKTLGINHGDMLKLELAGRSLEIAAFILPGQPERSVALPLGYGRKFGGQVADGVGFNCYALRTTQAMHAAEGLRITRTGATYKLASTHDHHAISAVAQHEEAARVDALVKTCATGSRQFGCQCCPGLIHWQQTALPVAHRIPATAGAWRLTSPPAPAAARACWPARRRTTSRSSAKMKSRADGRCTGCAWTGTLSAGDGRGRGQVFPARARACTAKTRRANRSARSRATLHDKEGLNEMVYNRCVGTRYCSNNCPYKVRRFNWWNNIANPTAIEKMVFNPEVTVRSRGVMEKCTYCIQRIEEAKIEAKLNNTLLADGAIVPACAQACPAQAIVFGDLNDPGSRVSKLHSSPRAYALLGEYSFKPRTKYLAKMRNPVKEHTWPLN